jgi:phospholipid/cholesterol/gamma-HCH transport system substrate-binding protein
MKEQIVNRAKLGAFVLIATTFLILGLYYIGSKKNIFHSTINVSADFNNVGGLMPGNNVRFNGINVGTVSKVYAISDTAIKAEFTIDEGSTMFITQNAIAFIGTDGLLGNKLIDISPGREAAPIVQEGSILKTLNSNQMDNALRTLATTNDNLKVITDNLKGVSEKFNNNNSLWHLLTDTIIAENIRNAVVRFKLTSNNTAVITGDLSKIIQDIKAGKGTFGALITDTSFSKKLNQTIINIQAVSDTVALISGDFKNISEKLKDGNGAIATLLTDTTFVRNLNLSMENIKDGSGNFNKNMEALKHNFLLRKYFRKLEKEKLINKK